MSEVFNIIQEFWGSFGSAVAIIWWVALPVILFMVALEMWLKYVRTISVNKIDWVTLEISIPGLVEKTPKAMEQVFAGIYSTYSFGGNKKFLKKYWDGKIDNRVSFEMVGIDGGMHFYIRTPDSLVNLIKTSIFSQFSDAEIKETGDYLEALPRVLPNETYDLWAAEMKFLKDNPYPIETYTSFAEGKDEKQIDPISAIAEVMSDLKQGEYVLIQFVISPTGKPTGDDIDKDGQEVIDNLLGIKKKEKKKAVLSNLLDSIGEIIYNLITAFFKVPEWSRASEEKDKKDRDFGRVSEGVKNSVKAIENKISKPIFKVSTRVVYVDRQDSFSPLNITAIMGYFGQYSSPILNGFKPEGHGYGKLIGRFFPAYKKYRENINKRNLFNRYKNRSLGFTNNVMDEKLPIFCSEELATLYHFPITASESSGIERLSSKKGEPPVRLPVK